MKNSDEQDHKREALLKIFLAEAQDLLDAIFATIQLWSTDLNNKTCFSDLKRDLHTLKGGARMIGLSTLSALAHELESLCEALMTGAVAGDRGAYELICRGFDRMRAIIEAIAKHEAPPDNADLFNQREGNSITSSVIEKVDDAIGICDPIKQQPIVLIVDDSVTIRTVLKSFLERHKYTVVTAEDGYDALEKLEQQRPNIILLDVEMPRMNGFQFAEKIRGQVHTAKIPIIMIT
jgi:CheY-like chemotaxis protein/HPt (histidine-containing phosphotransfer) domain-containing protein